jgi:hypothetical protein
MRFRPNETARHQVLLNVAFGDHQVTICKAEVMARTGGAAAHRPVLFEGRWPDTDALWDDRRRAAGAIQLVTHR